MPTSPYFRFLSLQGRCAGWLLASIAWYVLLCPWATLAQQAPPHGDPQIFDPTLEQRRHLTLGESHQFVWPERVSGSSNLAGWRLSIEQQGVALEVIANSSVEPLGATRWSSPLGRFDHQILLLDPLVGGFQVRALATGAEGGDYSLLLEPIVTESAGGGFVGPKARAEIAGLRLFTEACRLSSQSTADVATLRQAAAGFEAAAKVFGEVQEKRQQGRALLAAAILWRRSGDSTRALSPYRSSLDLWRQLGEPGFEALALEGLGQLARRQGRSDEAVQYLQRALGLWNALQQPIEAASTLGNLGLVAQTEEDLRLAQHYYREALAIFETTGQLNEQASLWLNLASVQSRLGAAAEAFESTGRSLRAFEDLVDLRGQIDALNNLAVLHRRVGEPALALAFFDRSRRLAVQVGDLRAEGIALNNLGYTYLILGEFDRAAELLQQALERRRQAKDRRGEMGTLHNLGQVEIHRQDLPAARLHLQAALALAVDLGSRSEVAIRGRLGHLMARLGVPGADANFEAAFDLVATGDNALTEAELHFQRGAARALSLGSVATTGAGQDLRRALELWQKLGDVTGQIVAHTELGRLEKRLGNLSPARHHLEAAIGHTEALRDELINPTLQASFLAMRQDAYMVLVDVLMTEHGRRPLAGFDQRALEVSEAMHARSLGDLLFRARVTPGSMAPTELLEERRALVQSLSLVSRQRRLVRLGRRKEMRGEDLDARLEDLQAKLDLAEIALHRSDPRQDLVGRAVALTKDEMQDLLDGQTLLLHFALGDQRSFLFALDGTRLATYVLPPRQQIEALARQVIAGLSRLGAAPEGFSELEVTLSYLLLGRVVDDFSTARRWFVVADGALHYLSFAALRLPRDPEGSKDATSPQAGQRVVERFEVIQLPSVQVLVQLRRLASARTAGQAHIAVLADPVLTVDDPRVPVDSSPGPSPPGFRSFGLSRLGGSGREAEVIAEVVAAANGTSVDNGASADVTEARFKVTTHRGFEASRDILDQFAAGSPALAVLHLATHGVVDTEHPYLSAIALSQLHRDGRRRLDGWLRLHDIFQLQLASELVVLSGCQTALGRDIRGEGLMGLTGGFLHAGARRVMASLWTVADGATVEWMRHFYHAYLVEGRPAAAALRQAQLKLAKDRRYRAPYYWAPFILVGDW